MADILEKKKRIHFCKLIGCVKIETHSSLNDPQNSFEISQRLPSNKGLIRADLPSIRLIDLRCIGELHGCVFVASLGNFDWIWRYG